MYPSLKPREFTFLREGEILSKAPFRRFPSLYYYPQSVRKFPEPVAAFVSAPLETLLRERHTARDAAKTFRGPPPVARPPRAPVASVDARESDALRARE